ncbi:MAG TPA: PAS domain S-box protein [Azospirillum sp.]|nr:PAS domain S-box protein [Azospirillum sp.]
MKRPTEDDGPTSPQDALQASLRHQRILTEFGTRALAESGVPVLLQEATRRALAGIGIDHAKAMRHRPETGDLLIVAGVGWREGVVGHATVPADRWSPAGLALHTHQPVGVPDLRAAGDLRIPDVLARHGILAVLNVPIGTDDALWGVLEVDHEQPRHFSESDVLFLQSLANLLGAAIQRAGAEQRAGLERAQLDAVLAQMPSGVAIAEAPSGRLLMHNARAVELIGHPLLESDTYEGYARYGALNEDGTPLPPAEYPIARAAVAGETVVQMPMRYRRGDGRITHFLVSAAPVRDADGNVVLAVSTFDDVDERVRTEAELRAVRDRLAHVLESTTDCVLAIGRDWRILYQNRRTRDLLNGGRDLTGVDLWEAYPAAAGSIFQERCRTAMAEQVSVEFDGYYPPLDLWLECHAHPSPDRLTVFFRDVSERRRQREAQAERDARYRATFEQAAVGMAHVDLDGHWIQINERLCEITGYPRDELYRISYRDITVPEDLPADLAQGQRLRAGEIDNYTLEKRYRRKDGAIVWVNLTVSLVRTADGQPLHYIAVVEDISARKRAEAEREELLRQQDLLMREMNHRIKNSLQMVANLVHMQSADLRDLNARWRFQETATRITTIARVHERLYRFSDVTAVDFAPYLRDLCHDLAGSLGLGGTRLTVHAIDANVPPDTALPLGLIVNELVTNAAKYAYPTGAPGPVRVVLDRTGGGRLRLSVSDEGVGLPPGFRPETSGGLGMRVLQALTAQLDADLHLCEQPRGTAFQVVLPMR